MKRARDNDTSADNNNDEPAAKRASVDSVSIVSTDAAAVRATYRTDCEIVATSGAAHAAGAAAAANDVPGDSGARAQARVFPVNWLILRTWSEPFGVMMSGPFAESATGRIELPFSAAAVSVLVQHAYSLRSLAEVPVISPESALEVMQLAHMYDQTNLLELASNALFGADFPMSEDVMDNLNMLRAVLTLGCDPEIVYRWFTEAWGRVNRRVLPSFAVDPADEVFQPLFTYVWGNDNYTNAAVMEFLFVPTEYTKEMRARVRWLLLTGPFLNWYATLSPHFQREWFLNTLDEYKRMRTIEVDLIVAQR